jgi:hypothetical protein
MLNIIFMIAATIGGTIMVCQFLLSVLGIGEHGSDMAHGDSFDHGDLSHGDVSHGDAAHDYTDDSSLHPNSTWLFGVLTFRTLVAGATFFGLAGKAALASGWSEPFSILTAAAVGLAAMYAVYWMMRLISKTTSSGNERIRNAVGRPATVYIAIPSANQGIGKVQLSMQNRIVEFQAITSEEAQLRSGESVEVIRVINNDTVEVRRERKALATV